jgi:hypothetical protein
MAKTCPCVLLLHAVRTLSVRLLHKHRTVSVQAELIHWYCQHITYGVALVWQQTCKAAAWQLVSQRLDPVLLVQASTRGGVRLFLKLSRSRCCP